VQIRVSARHTKISDREHDLITEKIERLSKFLPGMDRAEVHFSEERNPRIVDKEVCEVTLEGHGHHVRCRANGVDHLTAVDLAVEKLENKLHKLKTKLLPKPRHRGSARLRRAGVPAGVPELLDPDEAVDLAFADGPAAAQFEDGAALDSDPGTTDLEVGAHIVKMKTVEKLVLAPEDAAQRMDLMEHGFYFFINSVTGQPAVVYRRADGDVGLIDQEE